MKRITAAILMFVLFFATAFAANAYQRSITVDYNINLEINGGTPALTDVNGKTVQAFTHEGTTYVPIRAVAEEMGAYVGYDSSTNTAVVFQDDVEAIVLAHKMAEMSHTATYSVEALFSACQLYADGSLSGSSVIADMKQIADSLDNEYEKVYSDYNLSVSNQNIYMADIENCMSETYSEYFSAAQAIGNAVNFVTTGNTSYLQAVVNARSEILSNGTAYDLATNFIDSMW